VAAHLHDANLVVFHVGARDKYAASHITGARYLDISDISVSDHSAMSMPSGTSMPPEPISGPKNGLTLEMPTAEQLRSQLAKFGVSDNSRIVVYSANGFVTPTTRVIFTLDYAGLGNHTVLMDGGLDAWVRENRPVTDVVPPEPQPGKLAALSLRPLVVDANYVRAHAAKPGVSIVDARAASFYDGIPNERSGSTRLGHIPGAKSVPFSEVTDDQGKLKPVDQLRALFAKAGVQPGDTVVAYCHFGQQATATLFAARSLGHPVLLYDGSMNDWSKHADYPLETSSARKP
jgi:thiosulfate/3-mercaptopyruvate sulfurtransferase